MKDRKQAFLRRICIPSFLGVLLWFWGIPAPADGAKEIVFLTWKPNQPEVWHRLIERFHQENPDIRVIVQVGPHSSNDYHAIITQRLKNRDSSVDVFFMDVIWPAEFANAGWGVELTSLFPKREQEKFLPGPVRANRWKGGIFGVPCFLGAGLFYYREDLLGKYGFSPPSTWGEMLEQGRAIVSGEGDQGLFAYSGQFKQYEGLVCNMLEFVWSNGGEVINAAGDSPLLGSSSVIDAVSFVRDHIIGSAAPRGALNHEEPESLALFLQGKSVFHRNWPYAWALASDARESSVAGRIGVGMLPSFPGKEPASTLGGWQFGISRWSKEPEAAWRFIRFMTSYDSQKSLALQAGLAPTRRAVYSDPEVVSKVPHLKAFLPVFETCRPRPPSPLYPMISQELQRFFSQAIADVHSNLPSLAREASSRIDKILKLGARIR